MKSDISVAKNYMTEFEMKSLERVVGMYLDYAENQAGRQIAMRMADWVGKLDAFLQFAEQQYYSFSKGQDRSFESDFERAYRQLLATEHSQTPQSRSKRKKQT